MAHTLEIRVAGHKCLYRGVFGGASGAMSTHLSLQRDSSVSGGALSAAAVLPQTVAGPPVRHTPVAAPHCRGAQLALVSVFADGFWVRDLV